MPRLKKKTAPARTPAPAPVPPVPAALTCSAAAAYLSLSLRTLQSMISAGTIRSIKIGYLRRVLRTELDRYLAELAAEQDGFGGDAA